MIPENYCAELLKLVYPVVFYLTIFGFTISIIIMCYADESDYDYLVPIAKKVMAGVLLCGGFLLFMYPIYQNIT